jgi:hypothetical protein
MIQREPMNLPGRLRCFWSWPPGHPWEVIDYFDGVAGRWAAFSRCVRCDRTRGLAVGGAVHGTVFANNPLATGMSFQGTKLSAPPSAGSTTGAPRDEKESAEIALGRGRRLYVRRARASYGVRRGRTVYVAHIIGTDALRSASPNLRAAVARSMSRSGRSSDVESALQQLEQELG